MKYTITAPVQEFTGVVAGVHFSDGKAETDDLRAVAYFRRQGYTVEEQGGSKPAGRSASKSKSSGEG